MKEFTSQQKEIVARKLGYDGPMQGFDEFLVSNPALQMKYASLSGKFAERMANGGMVKKYQAGGAVTDRVQQVRDWWAANEGKGTQDDLDRWLATSGFTAAEMNAALPQFAITDLNNAINNAKAKYGTQSTQIQQDYDAYFASTKPGSYTDFAGGVLYKADPDRAIFITPDREYTLRSGSQLSDIAATIPEIAKQWEQQYGYKTTAPATLTTTGWNPLTEAYTDANRNPILTRKELALDPQLRAVNLSGYENNPRGAFEELARQVYGGKGMTIDDIQRLERATGAVGMYKQASDGSYYLDSNSPFTTASTTSAVPQSEIEAARQRLYAKDPELAAFMEWRLGEMDPMMHQRIGDLAAQYNQNPYVWDERSLASWKATAESAKARAGGNPEWLQSNWQQKQAARNAAYDAEQERQRQLSAESGLVTGPGNRPQFVTGPGSSPSPAPAPTPSRTPAPAPSAFVTGGGGGSTMSAPAPAPAQVPTSSGTSGGVAPGTSINLGGSLSDAPRVGNVPTVTAAQTSTEGLAVTPTQAGAATQAQVTQATGAAPVTTGAVAAPTATAAQAAPGVQQAVAGVTGEQGAVSEQARVTAAQMAPTTTAVSGLEAAQGVATQVTGAPTRTLETGELISGPAVDQARVEEALTKQQAAQGVVTEEMTVQGQLNKLMQNFDAGNPPPWAAATMRSAAAQMAARGLSASSMAGQAIIQAALESATPIAAADAKVFETMGLQNLSNRQQMAMLVAQQRAQFLGQEFDQAFQTRVLNAAKISDIANKNFDAKTQIAIENARLTNSMDIANLSARNALVLAEAAQISQLETQNLSNLQQAAVENARAFLAMDMKNLDNRQQTSLFKVQAITNALLQDASLQNAISITNANNKLDADKITQQLKFQADALNLAEQNKISLANALAANELSKFNAQQQNAREEFNANMVNQINVANAKVLAEVSLANTAAINAANALNAKNAVELTSIEYAQLSQTYRDLLEMSWKTGESEKDRTIEIAKATISANADIASRAALANADAAKSIGGAAIEVLKNWDKIKSGLGDIWESLFGDEEE